MSYVIEDGVPIPPVSGGRPRGMKRPKSPITQTLHQLKPSQSLLFDTEDEYQQACKYGETYRGREYLGRKIPRIGWRIWRIA